MNEHEIAQTILDAIAGDSSTRQRAIVTINMLMSENSPIYFRQLLLATLSDRGEDFVQKTALMAKNFLTSKLSCIQVLRGQVWKAIPQSERQDFIQQMAQRLLQGQPSINQLFAAITIQSTIDDGKAILHYLISLVQSRATDVQLIENVVFIFKTVYQQSIQYFIPNVMEMVQYLLSNAQQMNSKIIIDCVDIIYQVSDQLKNDVTEEIFQLIMQILLSCVKNKGYTLIQTIYSIFTKGIRNIDIIHRQVDGFYAIEVLLRYCIDVAMGLREDVQMDSITPLLIQQMQFVQKIVETEATRVVYNTQYVYQIIDQFIIILLRHYNRVLELENIEICCKTLSKIYRHGNTTYIGEYQRYVEQQSGDVAVYLQLSKCLIGPNNVDAVYQMITEHISDPSPVIQIQVCKIARKIIGMLDYQKQTQLLRRQLQYYSSIDVGQHAVVPQLQQFARELTGFYRASKQTNVLTVQEIFNCFIGSKRQLLEDYKFINMIRDYVFNELFDIIGLGNNNLNTIHMYLGQIFDAIGGQFVELRQGVCLSQLDIHYQDMLYLSLQALFFGFLQYAVEHDDVSTGLYRQLASQLPRLPAVVEAISRQVGYLVELDDIRYENLLTTLIKLLADVSVCGAAGDRHLMNRLLDYVVDLNGRRVLNEVFCLALQFLGNNLTQFTSQQVLQIQEICQNNLYQTMTSFPQISSLQTLQNINQSGYLTDIQPSFQFIQGLVNNIEQFNLIDSKDFTLCGIALKFAADLEYHSSCRFQNLEVLMYKIISSFDMKRGEYMDNLDSTHYANALQGLVDQYGARQDTHILQYIQENKDLINRIINWVGKIGYQFNQLSMFRNQFGSILK